MTNETLLQNIPFEDMKRYLESQGYAVVKRPVIKTRLKSCPICGRMPLREDTGISISYNCEDSTHLLVVPSTYAMPFHDECAGPIIAEYKSKEKADEEARKNWNDLVETYLNMKKEEE